MLANLKILRVHYSQKSIRSGGLSLLSQVFVQQGHAGDSKRMLFWPSTKVIVQQFCDGNVGHLSLQVGSRLGHTYEWPTFG